MNPVIAQTGANRGNYRQMGWRYQWPGVA